MQSLRPPVDQKLTSAKCLRLSNVQLTKDGIVTKGHIWRLGKTFTVSSYYRPGWVRDSRYGLEGKERFWFQRLIQTLQSGKLGSRYKSLAEDLEGYLKEDAAAKRSIASKEFKDCMAGEIIEAMKSGEKLRLACVVD